MRRAARALLPLLALLCLLFGAASAGKEPDPVPLGFRLAVRAKRSRASVFARADSTSEKLAELEGDSAAVLLGEEGSFDRVLLPDGRIGYVLRSGLEITAERTEAPLPEALCEGVSLKQAATARRDTQLELLGTLTADRPLDSVQFFLWDERRFLPEWYRILPLDGSSASVPLENRPRLIPLKDLSGGMKTLVIEGVSGGEITVLFRSPVYVRGKSAPLPDLNALCEGLPRSVLDTDIKTAWRPSKKKPSLDFTVAADAGADIMTLEWKTAPERCTVETMDGEGNTLSRRMLDLGFLTDCVNLEPGVRRITVTPEGDGAELSSLRLYAEPWPRDVIQRWEPVPEKIDLLVISTHQDDEFLFFGGAIPYYAAREDVSTAVLYMVNCGRLRYGEALDALWSAGLRNHPLFLNLPDSYTRDIRAARSLWNRFAPLKKLIGIFRKYRPEVVLVQDFRGEYGNGEHQLTAALAAEAVEKAALPEEDPESAGTYGPWQVKKLYVHLYAENQVRMDWDRPLGEDGVITPMFLARVGLDRHLSQTALYSMDSDGRRYDNSLFGLYFSAVGPDVEKNDFMENVRPAPDAPEIP